MAVTVYKPAHETTKAVNYDKVTATIRVSYLMHADEHTKVFMNKMEEPGLNIDKS